MSRLAEAQAALEEHRRSQADQPLDLFGPPAELAPVDEAIASVTAHAGPMWRDEVLASIERIARRQDHLVADDVWADLEARGEGLTYDRRALGGVLREAVKRGLIVSTAEYAPSARRHSSPLRVWRSASREGS
jgi:hypothetical protein